VYRVAYQGGQRRSGTKSMFNLIETSHLKLEKERPIKEFDNS
jgi:hypothetical protein